MKNYQVLNILCKNIRNGKFDDKRYRTQKNYYGNLLQTMPTFCSYGTIGFSATIWWKGDMHDQTTIHYDWEMKELEIEDSTFERMCYKDFINLLYLDENDITLVSTEVWDEEPRSVELETYTDAGEDMIIDLEEPTKQCLLRYVDDFDINEKVMLWWENGAEHAHSKGVPFDNIKDHYTDYEDFLKWLEKVANGMPH